jgi:hypothetical protein
MIRHLEIPSLPGFRYSHISYARILNCLGDLHIVESYSKFIQRTADTITLSVTIRL